MQITKSQKRTKQLIAFFGASVTAQSNGYVECFARLNPEVAVRKHGFGGMHLCDAGMCFLDQVLENKPNYCYIDWFSTGYRSTGDETMEYINTLIARLTLIQCKIVFLFLPYREDDKRDFYLHCKTILSNKNIHYLAIDELVEPKDINTILRDSIHTTDKGSEKYAEYISNDYHAVKLELTSQVERTRFMNIKTYAVEKCFSDELVISGDCFIIGFLLTIGNHSGLIKVKSEAFEITINTWDRWCHYPRPHFNLPMQVAGTTRLTILQDAFDTSSCKELSDFTRFEKKLIIHKIYYIGETLKVNNLERGKRIYTLAIRTKQAWGRLKQLARKIARLTQQQPTSRK